MIRRLLGVSAITLTAGLAVAGCAPVKMGAAAIVGDQRVTIANLDTESGKLAAAAQNYTGVFQLTPQQITQETLTWLIRFQINDQLAKSEGITVTAAQMQAAQSQIFVCAKQQAAATGGIISSYDELLTANGIAPTLADEVSRYQAIENQYMAANGGAAQGCLAPPAASLQKFTHAQCVTAKSLAIEVNPQFGRLDYSKYEVVSAPDTVSRPSGPFTASSLEGLTPAC